MPPDWRPVVEWVTSSMTFQASGFARTTPRASMMRVSKFAGKGVGDTTSTTSIPGRL
jgi:hypothetical protein